MITIHVCSNHEILADGWIADKDRYCDEIDSMIEQVCQFIDAANFGVESNCVPFYQPWRGGLYSNPGKWIDGKRYGYGSNGVATLAINPSPDVIALIDDASDLMSDLLAKLSEKESAEAKSLAADIAAGLE